MHDDSPSIEEAIVSEAAGDIGSWPRRIIPSDHVHEWMCYGRCIMIMDYALLFCPTLFYRHAALHRG
jgi:hypothetical protein